MAKIIYNQNNKKKKYDVWESSNKKSENAGNGYDVWESLKYKGIDTTDVDESYVKSFLTDAFAYSTAEKPYRDKYTEFENLQGQREKVAAWAYQNRNNIDPSAYSAIFDVVDYLKSDNDAMGELFKSKDEYDTFFNEWNDWYNKWGHYADRYDFDELSQYKSTAKLDDDGNPIGAHYNVFSDTYDETGYDDLHYEVINKNADARAIMRHNKSTGGPLEAVVNPIILSEDYLTEFTDEELAIYNYLYQTEPEKAEEFLSEWTPELNRRERIKVENALRKDAKESPISSSLFTILTSPLKGLSYLGQAGSYLSGNGIDQNAAYNRFVYANNAIRDEVSKDMGGIGKFLYNTGMSMGDFLFATGITGGNQVLSLAIMGSGAAADTVVASKDMGLSDDQAFWLGTIAGAAEVAMENISFKALLKADWSKGALNYVVKNALAEGVEEVGTDVINLSARVVDFLLSKDKSEWALIYDQYRADGLSESGAIWKMVVDNATEMLLDFAGGTLSGGTLGVGGAVINTVNYNEKYGDIAKESPALVEEALSINPDDAYAKKIKAKLDGGETLTGNQYYILQRRTEAAIVKNDMKTVSSNVSKRLSDLGETGDVSALSNAIAKKLSIDAREAAFRKLNNGETLTVAENELVQTDGTKKKDLKMTSAENQLIKNSKYAGRVLSELNPSNIKSGNYSTEWTKNFSTDRINPESYGEAAERNTVAEPSATLQKNSVGNVENKSSKSSNAQTTQNAASAGVETENGGSEQTDSSASLQKLSKKYGMQANAVENVYQKGQDVAQFDNAFKIAYDMGKSGVQFSYVEGSESTSYLTDSQKQQAYSMGVTAADIESYANESNIKKTTDKKNTRKKGRVIGDGVKVKDIGSKAFKIFSTLSYVTGIDIVLYKSSVDESGQYVGVQGQYSKSQPGVIRIDVNSGLFDVSDEGQIAKYTMLRTFSHEFCHFIENFNPVKYNEFRRVVFETITERGENVNDLIEIKVADEGLSYDAASREVVAEAMTDILPDSSFVKTLAEKHSSIFKQLLEKFKEFVENIKSYFSSLVENEDLGAKALKEEIDGTSKYLDNIIKMFDQIAVEAVENYQASAEPISTVADQMEVLEKETEMPNDEAFKDSTVAVQNQIRPPYGSKTSAFSEFINSLSEDARKTFELFHGFYQKSRIKNAINTSGKISKEINISSVYLMPSQWNEMVFKNEKWAKAAKDLADFLPEKIRTEMNMNADGTLVAKPLEEVFKMPSSMAQRLIDALPYENIDSLYTMGDVTIELPAGKARQSVGGEAYRRALIKETRKLYAEGKLSKVNINTMSKDRWGSLGFLASNGKTGASGDFTTICPQMFYNMGCWYCYRRAALKSGLNNKLVAQNVWYTGEILRIKDEDIKSLNANGGLRIQSFGDWMPHFSASLADVLYDAQLRGLQVKIITKEPSMINYIASLREQGIGANLYFNLSSDYTIEKGPDTFATDSNSFDTVNYERPFMRDENNRYMWKRALSVEEANKYREKYSWVNVRIVATDINEFIRGLKDPRVDVVTGYHGNIRQYERVDSTTGERKIEVEALGDAGMPQFSYDESTGEWVTLFDGKTYTHKRLAESIEKEGLQAEYQIKTCCIFGRCSDCNGKSGVKAKDFNTKNATNRDHESVAYWQKHLEYGMDPEFGDITIPEVDDQYSVRKKILSNREVLVRAAAELNTDEMTKEQIDALDALKNQLDELKKLTNQKIKAQIDLGQMRKNNAGSRDINLQKAKIDGLNDQIESAEAHVFEIENKEVIRDVMKKARKIVEKNEKEYSSAKLSAYRDRRDNSALTQKYRARIETSVAKLVEMLEKPSKEAHVPSELQKPLRDFIDSIDFRSKQLIKGGDPTVRDNAYTKALEAMRIAVDKQRSALSDSENGVYKLDVPPEFGEIIDDHVQKIRDAMSQMNEIADKTMSVYTMTPSDLKTLSLILSAINQSIRNIDIIHMAGAKNRVSSVAHMTMDEDLAAPHKNEIGKMVGRKPVKSEEGNPFIWQNSTPYSAFKRMGNGAMIIFKGFMKGQSKLAYLADEIIRFSKNTFKGDAEKLEKDVHSFSIDADLVIRDENGIPIKYGEQQLKTSKKTFQMSTAQIMSLYLLMKRPQAVQHILNGGMRLTTIKKGIENIVQKDHIRLTLDGIKAITSTLTAEQKAMANETQEYMQKRGGELGNEISMARWDFAQFFEDNYYPIKTDDVTRNLDNPGAEKGNLWALINKSFTKATNPNAKNALVVDSMFETFADHMSGMAEYNAFALPVIDAMKWFNYRESTNSPDGVHNSIKTVLGTNAVKYFTDLMIDINSSQKAGRNEGVVGKVFGRMKAASIAWTFRAVVQQPTSLLRASVILDMPELVKGVFSGNVKQSIAEMKKYSGIALWKSLGYIDVNVSRGLKSQIKDSATAIDKFNEAGFKGMEIADDVTWSRIWEACKTKVSRQQKLSGEGLMKATAELFEEVIYSTQVVDSLLTKSGYMRSKTQFMREITAFMSEATVSFNMMIDAFQDYDLGHNTWDKTKRGMGIIFKGYALSAIINAVVTTLFDAYRDDSDDEFIKKLKKAAFGEEIDGKNFMEIISQILDGNFVEEINPLEKVILVKDVLAMLKGYSSGSFASDVVKPWMDFLNGIAKEFEGKGNKTDYGHIYDVLKSFGTMSGFGAANLAREIVSIWNAIFGTMDPSLKIQRYKE